MYTSDWLAVTGPQALRFFFERLRDVSEDSGAPEGELLYNASLLAHFASTSATSTTDFPAAPTDLTSFFDTFVMDRSGHVDPDILEAGASQCLLLTGFFCRQVRRRHNVDWYAALGAGYFRQAAERASDRDRARMMRVMAGRFDFWRYQQDRLARELRDLPFLILQKNLHHEGHEGHEDLRLPH
jgi:hypothetical protein